MAFFIASSPHTQKRRSLSTMMLLVALCAVPGILAQTYFFGFGTLIQVLFAILVAWTFESLIMLARGRSPIQALRDNTALVTALLLAIAIPPLSPWWITVIGLFFAIVVAKHLYGGVGQNLFNPAMVAYVVLLISFPVQMTSWLTPAQISSSPVGATDALSLIFSGYNLDGMSLQQIRTGVDGITMATPLDTVKTGLGNGQTLSEISNSPLFSGIAGYGWEWINVLFLIGGLIMLKLRVIQWYIPAGVLSGVFLTSLILYIIAPGTLGSPLFQLFSGATMLGAFFIATDPVSAATTIKGRLIFGGLIGALIVIIRTFGGFPDGVAFAVIIANMCVPLIDYYTQPRTYGHK
ncbi:electron transport complex subunit RsxD [Vibrio breoganii]|uniref:Ion-translocating oxidoreductase complex subunit D n=1 Tax=Vibrio breoganii TaxID=553239 RepID=A0ABX1U9F4_9VIBR|nr:electron transport complex subunit RsxD [Vibrio breoganii]NMO73118.1 electron transport complex subunit RsxD [Vibrio breoganii]NMR69405.1 electron transport complex subunit RsxD [Vibrio breoganii]PMK40413.1 electron transport complex subunit RsxD [Vibrio breoganii]PML35942.1 electron transport complex subunit RsxD [Vibrio breoganii]PML40339.1 electron transport complex subunit RsxD [Vibrio breoganii]